MGNEVVGDLGSDNNQKPVSQEPSKERVVLPCMVVIRDTELQYGKGKGEISPFPTDNPNKKPEDKESRCRGPWESAPQGSTKGRKGQRMDLGLKGYT